MSSSNSRSNSESGNKYSNSIHLTSRSNDLILSSSSPTDPLLEQHDVGNSSSDVAPDDCSSVSGFGRTVAVLVRLLRWTNADEFEAVENLCVLFLLLNFLLLFVVRAAELEASMANAAWARVLTPTWTISIDFNSASTCFWDCDSTHLTITFQVLVLSAIFQKEREREGRCGGVWERVLMRACSTETTKICDNDERDSTVEIG